MDENRVEGTAQSVAGRVQDAAGGLTGDHRTQGEGKARQMYGRGQDYYGEAMDTARGYAADAGRTIEERPLTALMITGGVCFLLGVLLGRR